ncbi:MAG: AlpA family phage regulatory protein [Sulfuritalea sp.]|nr:AlpA family phage regulatory protein [Sulfuritalea sp.]
MPRINKPAIPSSLRYFDSLPDSANVRLPVVCGLTGVGPATVWRMSLDGRLPASRKLGPKVTTWNVGELRQALRKVSAPRLSSTSA